MQLPYDQGRFEAVEDRHADVHEDYAEALSTDKALFHNRKCLQPIVGSVNVWLQALQTYLLYHHLQSKHVERLIVNNHYFLLKYLCFEHLPINQLVLVLNPLLQIWVRYLGQTYRFKDIHSGKCRTLWLLKLLNWDCLVDLRRVFVCGI